MAPRTAVVIAAGSCVLATATGASGTGDDSTGPGRAALTLISQIRTLDASGLFGVGGEPPSCQLQFHDEAPDFGPYSNTLIADCGLGYGEASQTSNLTPADISATGSASGVGGQGGGHYADGWGQSWFQVSFESQTAQWITLSGQLHEDGYDSTSLVRLTEAGGAVLLELQPPGSPGTVDFLESFQLQPGVTYTLRLEAFASGVMYTGSTAQYTVVLSMHCPADVNGDNVVDVLDLLEVLAAWGACGEPLGACCLPDGSCTDSVELGCLSAGGAWFEGESCATLDCPPVFCEASGGCSLASIARVVFGNVNNASDCGFYQDFTNLTVDLQIGIGAGIVIENGDYNGANLFSVWIDWNQNNDLTDPGEAYLLGDPGEPMGTALITPPPDAMPGLTGMRVRVQYDGTPEPCGSVATGEVEDYSIHVAGPQGDWIGDPWIIETLPYSDSNDTSLFGNQYDEQCPHTGSTAPEVVYAYSPMVDEIVTIDLCDSAYDTKVYVYENVEGNLVACNDDGCPDGRSRLEGVSLTAGNTYYIIVDGTGAASGTYVLSIDFTPIAACCTPDGGCLDTIALTCAALGGDWYEWESCATFNCPPLPTGACCLDTDCIATNIEYECEMAGGVWYEGQDCATYVCHCAASGGGPQYISRAQLGEIDNQSGNDGYGNHTQLSTTIAIGETQTCTVTNGDPHYWDRFSAWADWNNDGDFTDSGETLAASLPGGEYVFDVTPPPDAYIGDVILRLRIIYVGDPPPCGYISSGEVEDYTITIPPPGDTIEDAIVVHSLPYFDARDTALFGDDYDEVCSNPGSLSNDVVYRYAPVGNTFVDITLCADSQYDTKLYVYEDLHTPGAPYGCNDDACTTPGGQTGVSELTGLHLKADRTYYIVIDGNDSQNGPYTLDIY